MEKYIYKCENTICENEFKDSEPQNCPKCGSEDIIIIGEPKRKLWLILIIVLFIAALGGGYWYYQLEEGCNCTHENNIHLECCDDYHGTIKQVKLDTNHHENYIEVLSPGVDKFQITLEDKKTNEKNKIHQVQVSVEEINNHKKLFAKFKNYLWHKIDY